MKNIIFSGRIRNSILPEKTGTNIRRNILWIVFILIVTAGAAAGALSGKYADSGLMKSLDIIFLTNMQLRTGTEIFRLFTASFASNFIFLLSVFLTGLTLWGLAAVPFIPFIKGYGYGLTAGYVYSQYGMPGIFYNILVILPGAFLFALVISAAAKEAFSNSLMLVTMFMKRAVRDDPAVRIKQYLLSMLWLLFLTALSSAADMIFSLMFSWIFGFSG